MDKPKLNSSDEAKAARAVILSYESFMLAVWIWNYMGDTTLAEKRQIVQTLRSQPKSVWEYVKEARACFPNPTNAQWKDCVRATGFPVPPEEELSDVIKMKLNLGEEDVKT
jgi:hypothetical protein